MAYRRSIRINGKEKKSPEFRTKADADRWYDEQKRLKTFLKEGIRVVSNSDKTVKIYFYGEWLPRRKKRGYTKNTWGPDEQRFRDYVEKPIGDVKVSRVNQLQVRSLLRDVTDKHGRSIQTRNRVRALLSKLFNDAMNEETALRSDNPALNISFDDPRVGEKKPEYIRDEQSILKFMKTAKALGHRHFVYASIQLMTGLRKQEFIALRWNDFNPESAELVIDEKYIQAENKIMPGTKAGSDEERVVPIPDALVETLRWWRGVTEWSGPKDFILGRPDGALMPSREVSLLHDEIRAKSGIDVPPHALRHSFGRQYVARGGNLKALQALLGHSSSAVTELYSKLAGKAAKSGRNIVSFDVDGGDDE